MIAITGSENGFLSSRLKNALKPSEYIRRDVRRSPILLNEWLDLHKPDCVVHCAGLANVRLCMQMPAEAYQANTIDTIVLLNALSGRGIKLIYVATDKVYGDQEQCTLDTVFKPLNAYDVSKVAAEVVVGEWAGRNPCVLARFPNFFGPGDPHLERLIPGVVRAIEMKQEKFVVRTIPDASRQYIFIEDAVGIIQNLIYSAQHSAQGRHHFGSPIVKTVRQVIGDLCDLFDHKMQLLIDNLQGEASKLSLAHCSSLPQLYTSWESSLDSFLERR